MRFYRLLFFTLFIANFAIAQKDTPVATGEYPQKQTIPTPINKKSPITSRQTNLNGAKKDSILVTKDTLQKDSIQLSKLIADSLHKDSLAKLQTTKIHTLNKDTTTYRSVLNAQNLPFTVVPYWQISKERLQLQKDSIFYTICFAIFLLGFVKLVFPKYFGSIFMLFFQTSFKTNQSQEIVLQNQLPSVILNIFFVITGGLYLANIVQLYKPLHIAFDWLMLYSVLFLVAIYFFKYLFLIFSGWVFNISNAMRPYSFIVFIVNKIMAILLLPFVLLLSFSHFDNNINDTIVYVSLVLMGSLFLYRYLVSAIRINKEIKLSPLHFFLYFFAVEVLPLLILVKFIEGYINQYA